MSSSRADTARIARLLIALAWGGAAGVAGAFALAIPLAILNLYLSGHGITWQERIHALGPLQLSWLDLALDGGTLAIALTTAWQNYSRTAKER